MFRSHLNSSLPGSTRQSMLQMKLLALAERSHKRHVSMDARVRPANDE
jgi:hypothetical protein